MQCNLEIHAPRSAASRLDILKLPAPGACRKSFRRAGRRVTLIESIEQVGPKDVSSHESGVMTGWSAGSTKPSVGAAKGSGRRSPT